MIDTVSNLNALLLLRLMRYWFHLLIAEYKIFATFWYRAE